MYKNKKKQGGKQKEPARVRQMIVSSVDKDGNLVIPKKLKSLDYYLLDERVKSIFIHASIRNIDVDALAGFPNLERIEVDSNNLKYYSENNCLIERDTKRLIKGALLSKIPSDVKIIGKEAFASCDNLKGIVIPASVHTIEFSAFVGLPELEDVTIPKTVMVIENYAFFDCPKLAIKVVKREVPFKRLDEDWYEENVPWIEVEE